MSREQAAKVANDFAYLMGKIIDFIPDQPTINNISIDEDLTGQYHVKLHARNPHPSIGREWTIYIYQYCREAGIDYTFPS